MQFREFVQQEGLMDFFRGKGKVPSAPPVVTAPIDAEREPQTEEEILQAAAKASGHHPGVINSPRFENQGGFNRRWSSWEKFMADPMPVMQKLDMLKKQRQDSADQYAQGIGHRGIASNS